MPEPTLAEIQRQLAAFAKNSEKSAGLPLPDEQIDVLLRRGKAIYGNDSRVEVRDAEVPASIIGAVCVLAERKKLVRADGGYTLETRSFGDAYRLCEGQPFREQPLFGFCSGFLVAPNVIATAAHCIRNHDPADLVALFDWEVRDGEAATHRADAAVYGVAKTIATAFTPNAEDWAIVELERPVQGAQPLRIDETPVQDRDAVYVIGHPAGLPKKIARDAWVTRTGPPSHFETNLDTFGGNSGSPVFGPDHRVRGILVRGARDFVRRGGCFVATTFPLTQGGEEVCKAAVWADKVPTKGFARTGEASSTAARNEGSKETGVGVGSGGGSVERAPVPRKVLLRACALLLRPDLEEIATMMLEAPTGKFRQATQAEYASDLIQWVSGQGAPVQREFEDLLRERAPNAFS